MARKLVFVVDDEPSICRIVKVNLERQGYDVETEQDSVKALDRLRSGQVTPDLILSDVTMPYMDGFEFLSQVKAESNLKDIPFVMVTARSRDADIIEGHDRGAAFYMTKPIVLTELFSVVRQAIGEPTEETGETGA